MTIAMKFLGIFILCFVLLLNSSLGQGRSDKFNDVKINVDLFEIMDSSSRMVGDLTIYKDARIDRLIQKHIDYHEEFPFIRGYKVQIFASPDKKAALDMKARYLARHPDDKIEIDWAPPYWKLRIGNYRTIWEAKKKQQELLQETGTAYVVPDDIEVSDLY